MADNYTQAADDFLEQNHITFRAVLIGSDCPTWCEDSQKDKDMDKVTVYPRRSHIHGKHYRCTFTRRIKVSEYDGKPVYSTNKTDPFLSIDFWNSYADEELLATWHSLPDQQSYVLRTRSKRVKPTVTAYSALSCLEKHEIGSFRDFCSNFGYDEDSRKAESVYHAVVAQWAKTKAFFNTEELEKLQDIQ